ENRLSEVMSGADSSQSNSKSIGNFIERVASAQPVPGGGSVAALAGSLGAALGQMAIRITREKKNYRDYVDRYSRALDKLAVCNARLLELIDADAAAYSRVMRAYQTPKDSPGRDQGIQDALAGATEIPSQTASMAADALRVFEDLREIIHPNVISDFQVG